MASQIDTIQYTASEIIAWLSMSPSNEEVLRYIHRFPEERRDLLPAIGSEVIASVRGQRRQVLSEQLSGNYLSVLDEQTLLEFMSRLGRYAASSVIQHYQKKLPTLVAVPLVVNPSALEAQVELWSRSLYFIASLSFDDVTVHMHALLSSQWPQQTYADLQAEIDQNLAILGSAYLKMIPVQSNLDIELSEKLRTLFRKMRFIPEETTNTLLRGSSLEHLYQFLRDLSTACRVVALGLEGGIPPGDTKAFDELLLFELKDELEIKLFATSVASKSDMQTPLRKHYQALAQRMTLISIQDGSYVPNIRAYLATVPEAEKGEFKNMLRDYMENSVVVQSVLTPLPVDSVFENIVSLGMTERDTYIRSLELQCTPALWPLARGLMLFFAELI